MSMNEQSPDDFEQHSETAVPDDSGQLPVSDLEYTGLMAKAWDPLRGDTSGWEDRAFFLSVIRDVGEPVLDIGCGTGRLLLDYLALGIDVDGIEISPDMISILRDKAVQAGLQVDRRVHNAAMETFDLARKYRLVIVPSASFQLIIDPADAAAAMAQFYAHLQPGGTLAMTWIDLSLDYPDGAEDRFVKEAPMTDGTTIRRTFHGWFDSAAGLENTDDRYERLQDGNVIERERQVRSPATRNYLWAAIADIHRVAGFDSLRFMSLAMDAAKSDDRVTMTIARRPMNP
jgi:SAM-dependent methyltransferase